MKKINNNSGIILLTVIVLSIVLSIISIGIVSIHISHKRSSDSIVKNLNAEQLAISKFMEVQQIQNEGCVAAAQFCTTLGDCSTCDYSEVIDVDGKNYTVTVTETAGTGPLGTNTIDVSVTY